MLMEQMLSKFDAFGEVQSDLRDRLGRVETDLHAVKEKVNVIEPAVRSQGQILSAHTQDLRAIKSDVATLKSDVSTLKSDVAEIKGDFKGYNQRLEVVEAKLAS